MNNKLEIYRDKQKQYRWRLRASNGRVLADCSEGYRRRIDCVSIALKLFPTARLVPGE